VCPNAERGSVRRYARLMTDERPQEPDKREEQFGIELEPGDAGQVPVNAEPQPVDPRAKEAALERLRDSTDEELAVFEGKLRDDALQAGASEQEMREAQATHPEH
jgi:hypothetical protein